MLQWHVDGAFYGKLPPAVTALQCAEAPTSVPKAHSFDDAEPLQYKVRITPSSFFEPFVDYKRQIYQDRLGTSIGKAETIRITFFLQAGSTAYVSGTTAYLLR